MGQQLASALASVLNLSEPSDETAPAKEPYPYEKLQQQGKVAVIYSPSFRGGGWWTRNRRQEGLLFDADIARAVMSEDYERVIWLASSRYPNVNLDSVEMLQVQWVPAGAKFEIDTYDGAESVRLFDETQWFTA
jgi:hypothetical protein